ncbi:hypothetical protein TI03_01110 [Achromatium sp. WMS1]|nr:hypothetical protein TI03_01110 [Achromatium sp. WMS1]
MFNSFDLNRRLEAGTKTLDLELTSIQIQQLLHLITLLTQWGRAYNLTAIKEPIAMIDHHILDSLTLLPFLKDDCILDIGTGAGFPGLPLAIIKPHANFTLLDSNGKKIRFVRQALLELKLHNVQVVHMRIEKYQEKFSTIIARALAPLPKLLHWAMPLLQHPGVLLALKGRQVHSEIANIDPSIINLEQIQVHQIQIPNLGTRQLVRIQFT